MNETNSCLLFYYVNRNVYKNIYTINVYILSIFKVIIFINNHIYLFCLCYSKDTGSSSSIHVLALFRNQKANPFYSKQKLVVFCSSKTKIHQNQNSKQLEKVIQNANNWLTAAKTKDKHTKMASDNNQQNTESIDFFFLLLRHSNNKTNFKMLNKK